MSTVTGVTGPGMTAFDASRVALEDLFEAHNLGWNWLGVWSNMVIAPNPHLTAVRPTSQMPVSLCDEDSSADEADQEALPERKRPQRLSSTGNDDVRNRLSMLEATSSRRLLPAAVDTVRPSLPQTSSPGTNGQPEGRPPDAGTVLRLGSRYGSTELV